MPKAHRKRRIRRPFRFHLLKQLRRIFRLPLFKRPPYFKLAYIALGCIICLSVLLAWSGTFKSASKKETSTSPKSVLSLKYRVTGEPSIDAAFIDSVLQRYHSPASGAGEAFYNQGVKYGIDPVF